MKTRTTSGSCAAWSWLTQRITWSAQSRVPCCGSPVTTSGHSSQRFPHDRRRVHDIAPQLGNVQRVRHECLVPDGTENQRAEEAEPKRGSVDRMHFNGRRIACQELLAPMFEFLVGLMVVLPAEDLQLDGPALVLGYLSVVHVADFDGRLQDQKQLVPTASQVEKDRTEEAILTPRVRPALVMPLLRGSWRELTRAASKAGSMSGLGRSSVNSCSARSSSMCETSFWAKGSARAERKPVAILQPESSAYRLSGNHSGDALLIP
jgi:hypothetical protein